MCGIAGFMFLSNHFDDFLKIKNVKKLMEHRGPDDFNFVSINLTNNNIIKTKNPDELEHDNSIVLIHTRLSIIDLTANAAQPMINENNTSVITYNGEVYNYLELKNSVVTDNKSFKSKSDTEVVLKLLDQENSLCLPKLRGMFAFGYVNLLRKQLMLACDPFGIKPLYYLKTNNIFAFASEPKFLIPFIPTIHANNQIILQYLINGSIAFGENTCFSDIKKLEGGSLIVFDLSSKSLAQHEKYISYSTETDNSINFNTAKNKIREMILNNVALHCRSDVPIASLLSGGLDSSTIVCSIIHQSINPNLITFSYFSKNKKLNEIKWVNYLQSKWNVENYNIQVEDHNIAEDIEQLVYAQDQPFVSLSLYAQYKLFQLVKSKGIKVTLDGQGADEIFAGYIISIITRILELFKAKQFSLAFNMIFSLITKKHNQLSLILRNVFFGLLPDNLKKSIIKDFNFRNKICFLNPQVVHDFTSFKLIETISNDYLKSNIYTSLKDQLKDYLLFQVLPALLRYEDRNSMNFSIESRVPFLTYDLVNYVYSLPESFLISKNGTTKYILREAMRGIVPEAILNRKDKIGFETPDSQIILKNSDYFDKWLTKERLNRIPFLEANKILEYWQNFKAGQQKYDKMLWRIINLIIWSEQFQINFS